MSISNEHKLNKIDKWNMFYKSIKINLVLVFCFIVQILGLAILYPSNPTMGAFGNIVCGIITFIISVVSGYYVHVYSHMFDYENKYCNLFNSSNIAGHVLRSLPKPIKWIIEKYVYLLNFHNKIHHNTNINKQWHNIIIETMLNILTEGVFLITLFKLLNFGIKIRGHIFTFNYPILFAWSILYATIHNINYNIITPICHIQHHLNEKNNYGIDFMDILFGSKYDDVPEEINHASLNVILILLFIIFIKDFCKPTNDNGISTYLYNFINWFVSY